MGDLNKQVKCNPQTPSKVFRQITPNEAFYGLINYNFEANGLKEMFSTS